VNTTHNQRQEIISRVVEHAKKTLSGSDGQADFLAFLSEYYRNFSLEDIKNKSEDNLFGAAISHWRLAQHRAADEKKVSIFNPSIAHHGWESSHTVLHVVMRDIPFLVDSIKMELDRLGCGLHLVANVAGMPIQRDSQGQMTGIEDAAAPKEVFMVFFISKLSEADELNEVLEGVQSVIHDVEVCVADWKAMKASMQESINELAHLPDSFDAEDIAETRAFLEWLLEYFTFMGCRQYDTKGFAKKKALHLVPGSSLGVLRDESHSKVTRLYEELPPDTRKLALSQQILMISKTNTQSTVHRPAYTDVIGIKRFDKHGKVIGEKRFIGLFTSDAYDSDPSKIPILRKKVQAVIQKSGFEHNLHSYKRLLHILKNLPRDELFQITTDDLCSMSLGILEIQDKRKIRLFARRDIFNRFMSCLVYIPRDNFNTEIRIQVQDILLEAFHGTEVIATPSFSASPLARVHFIVRLDPNNYEDFDYEDIEEKIVKVARSWKDELLEKLLERHGEHDGIKLYNQYGRGFSIGYQDTYSPVVAVSDIHYINQLTDENDLQICLYRPATISGASLAIKIFQAKAPIALADAMHILENMNLKVITEKSYNVRHHQDFRVCISDFEMLYVGNQEIDINHLGAVFQESFEKIWHGEAENDKFNSMVLEANLSWFQVSMIRAYARYLRQIGFNLSEGYIQDSLSSHTHLVRLLVQLFEARFNPEGQDVFKAKTQDIQDDIIHSLDKIDNIDDDRIIRKYMEAILATDRTSYYQRTASGDRKPYLVLKLASRRLSEIPLPKPKHETFIYSPRFEGVHLRFDSVARGGIRWSDRREDFRTEVLGLMKAQQVKNAVIVPSGSKGGFVAKCLESDMSREAMQAEGIACYKSYISGLLDITDNLLNGTVIKPIDVLCHDGDDSYLVVAADKGTATFSDIANDLSESYGFWLKDAFASGGSIGYDHKKMGITARGAWESVKRHFLERDIDIHKPFTVVGIGDMAGDVFGNGMLLSNKIKLVGAFNHKHIFIDPTPVPEKSFLERKRLFEMPGSQWSDYSPKLISKGGGVFPRTLKYIPVTPEMADLLDINVSQIRPDELIQTLLRADVDLLWNGGIGTYIKSAQETDADAGDRSNDPLRINGAQVRAKVFAEGGNLGATQLGRIEYEFSGGRVNTDFIDNVSGVNCSDHEVNIKILLNQIVDSGDMTMKQRNTLIEEMTDEVADLVIEDSFKTNVAISLAVQQLNKYGELMQRFMEKHEHDGKINLEVEFLPSKNDLMKRKTVGRGLTRPELSVLFSYSKIIMRDEILQGDFMNDPAMLHFVEKGFPSKIYNHYQDELRAHYLYKEIAATMLCNQFVLEMGITFVQQLQDELGVSTCDIVKAYIAAREILLVESLLQDLRHYYPKIPAQLYLDILIIVRMTIRRVTRWLLRNKKMHSLSEIIQHYSQDAHQLIHKLPQLVVGSDKQRFTNLKKQLVDVGINVKLATKVATFDVAYAILNIIEAAKERNNCLANFAVVYFQLSDQLGINWLRSCVNEYPVKTRWDIVARVATQSDLDRYQRAITSAIVALDAESSDPIQDPLEQIARWIAVKKPSVDRWLAHIAEIQTIKQVDFAVISVISRELFELSYL
jgi:glutamate dehydrogenase